GAGERRAGPRLRRGRPPERILGTAPGAVGRRGGRPHGGRGGRARDPPRRQPLPRRAPPRHRGHERPDPRRAAGGPPAGCRPGRGRPGRGWGRLSILLFFVDGFGLGPDDPRVNPLAAAPDAYPGLNRLLA